MCIPIELDVPVLTADGREVGTAREISCPCPGDHADDGVVAGHGGMSSSSGGELWLLVQRPGRSDLYIPFVEIAETRPDGVCLRSSWDDLDSHGWDRIPPGFPVPAGVA
jgi:hypothetical protein